LGWFELSDTLRKDAAATVAALKTQGIVVSILSGDGPAAVAQVAESLDIRHFEGGLRPEDKLQRLKALQAEGAVVLMVGDGVNDAPVLAGAQVSLAVGAGTQLAQASSDMVLLSQQLGTILTGIKTAQVTSRIIRQNLGWSLAYNISAIPLAALGWIVPWMAALGMSISSLVVVLNAMRLRGMGRTNPGC
jgi:Cu2+-exporting ATPase